MTRLDLLRRKSDPFTLALLALAYGTPTPAQWLLLNDYGWGDAPPRAAQLELAELAKRAA